MGAIQNFEDMLIAPERFVFPTLSLFLTDTQRQTDRHTHIHTHVNTDKQKKL